MALIPNVSLEIIALFVLVKTHLLAIPSQDVYLSKVRPYSFIQYLSQTFVLALVQLPAVTQNPCFPSPCGLNSECREIGNLPSCSCLPNYIGSPPNCRPECSVNSDCTSNLACIREKCRDPCPGSCGINAQCRIISHIPICNCIEGYTGDPFIQCNIAPEKRKNSHLQSCNVHISIIPSATPAPTIDACNPSPCGPNAQCLDGICTCIANYQGDPYRGCRPECLLNSDCASERSCVNNKCINTCLEACGRNTECSVINHIPMCSCITGYTGNAFVLCSPLPEIEKNTPCIPSPCGPNSVCREVSQQAVCSCIPGFIGSPPTCRPECITSTECQLNQACSNQRCIDPCPGSCGLNSVCQIVNHHPICICKSGYTGDPFVRCSFIGKKPT